MRADRAPEPDEQRVLRLAVNRLAEKGEWNLDELKIEFEELILSDAPIEISGFSPARSTMSFSASRRRVGAGAARARCSHCGRQGWRYLSTRSASHRLR